ncbi:DUF6221 family protein [Streptomyces lavendulae]|uniref:DUF6221 family protein n=1 Tax=Streptomyces lavendulae TaxID=1914 RepID=UPI003324ED9D
MDDLVQFLRDRLADDEQTAKALCIDTRPGHIPRWELCGDGSIRDSAPRDPALRVRFTWAPEARHIVRHDPVRVLAEVKAKRAVIGLYELAVDHQQEVAAKSYRDVLRLLSVAYADHPDFTKNWAPDQA